MGEKDLTEKTLVAFDDVFADIVNGLLFGGDAVVGEYALEDAQPFSAYKADGKLHGQERDVSKYWKGSSGNGANVRLAFWGIENQTEFDKDMPLRVIGYDGASYRSELKRNERYPVVTLVLYFGNKHWGNGRSLYDVLQIPERFRPFVSDYRINVFEIAYLSEETLANFHSDFRIVADYFVHRRTDPNYRPSDPERFHHVDELLKLMTVLTQDSRFEETLLWKGGKPENMCEVLDRVEARGMEKGIEKGIEENRIENIKTVMKKLAYTSKQAMDLLDIPLTEREKYISRL